MSDIYYIRKTLLTALGDKIRKLAGLDNKLSPTVMVTVLDGLSASSSESGEITFSGIKDEIIYTIENSDENGVIINRPALFTDMTVFDTFNIPRTNIIKFSVPFVSYLYSDMDSASILFKNGIIETFSMPSASGYIPNEMFRNCTSLETVNLNQCEQIGSYAFSGCTALTSIELPECTSVYDYAFKDCTALTSISLPECEDIGTYVFKDCAALASISLPLCTDVGDYIFDGCTNLTSVDMASIVSIGSSLLHGANNIESISFAKCGIVSSSSFEGCASLVNVILPECTEIDDHAFKDCTALTSISLPKCQYNIYGQPFEGCTALTSISLSEYDLSIEDEQFSYNSLNIETLYCPKCSDVRSLSMWTSLHQITLPTYCSFDSDAFSGVLDPDNKVFKMYFVQSDSDNSYIYSGDSDTLFGESSAPSSEGNGSGSGSGSGSGASEETYDEIPGLLIYVPDNMVDRFKTEFCNGRYAQNIHPVSEDV